MVGEVVESSPPRRLVTTWSSPDGKGGEADDTSRVTFDIEPYGEIVRLTVTHEDFTDEAEREEAAHGWAAVLSNLKSLLETGHVLPRTPWEMPEG